MKNIFYFFLIYILYHFSEGKICHEEYRAHKTRCDAYFKCVILPSNSQMWIAAKCQLGLIFDANLKQCVLPDNNWDCNLDEKSNKNSDENVVYGIDLLENIANNDDESIKTDLIVINNNTKNSKLVNDKNLENINNNIRNEILFESSGDGSNDSGDYIEVKENYENDSTSTTSRIDPKLTEHLQRLSQLINGLKKSYKNNNNKDLRPDQLNAFLAHFNIKNEFDNINTKGNVKLLNNTGVSSIIGNNKIVSPAPETKIIIKNIAGKKYKNNAGYSNSQIVVNRPEGSVLFSLTPNNPDRDSTNNNYKNNFYDNEPKISEETLRTVLELSKQMISNQNLRQILPNSDSSEYADAYMPSEPIYYPSQHSTYPDHHPHSHHHPHHLHHHHPHQNFDKITYVNHNQNDKIPTTIIHNHVMPVQITTNGEHGYHKPHKTTTTTTTTTKAPTTTSTTSTTTTTKKPYHHHHPHHHPHHQIYYPHHHHHGHFHHHGHHKHHGLFDSYGDPISAEYDSSESHIEAGKDNSNVYANSFNPTTESLKNVLPEYIKKFYTPNPHLDNSNANQVYDGEVYPNFSNKPELIFSRKENLVESFDDKTKEIHTDLSFENIITNYENGVNKKIVNNRLTPFNIEQQLLYDNTNTKNKLKHNNRKLVKIGDSYMSYDTYENELLPALNGNLYNTNIEIISCNPGVRQPNETDCTKYYVCSKSDGRTLSYSCPPFTGFNLDTKICDAKTYTECHPTSLYGSSNYFSLHENQKVQLQALKALQEAKVIRAEALQAQQDATLIRLKDQNEIIQMLKNQPTISPIINYVTATAYAPIPNSRNSELKQLNKTRTRKYYCKEGDKVADQTSVLNYYVCYKGKDGKMNGHKMTCSSGLMFCTKTKLCTLPKNCNN